MKKVRQRPAPDKAALAAVFFPLAAAMYYFDEQSLHLGIDVLYKRIFAALIAALSFAVFLVKTDLERAGALGKYFFLLVLPHLMALLVSIPLWGLNASPLATVRRGVFAQLYCIAIILAGAGLLYVFGEAGLWLNLAAMLAANLITLVGAVRASGIRQYARELGRLVATFGGEIGPAIGKAEINELTFALGLGLLFLLLTWKEAGSSRLFWPALVLTAFCFLSGFKRIGAFAIAVCLLAGLALRALTGGRENRRGWLLLFAAAVMLAAFAYVCLVRAGIFEFLERRLQIHTMGRQALSAFIEDYYSIGPDFLGRGAGFVSRLFSDLPGKYGPRALHNDILVLYIDLGFWGFWLWLLAFLPVRAWMVAKWQGIRGGCRCFCYCLFIFLTALTDNTIYYVYVMGAAALFTMGGHFQGKTAEGGAA